MYCILYIKTNIKLDEYRWQLIKSFGSTFSPGIVQNKTSQANAGLKYFCGNTHEKVHYLIRMENNDSFSIFIEGAKQRNNLNHLVTGVEWVFDDVKSVLDKLEVKCMKISASIWSEEEEMLKGIHQNYWVKLKSHISDLPMGFYLAILTFCYSLFQTNIEGTETPLEDSIVIAFINFLMVLLASFLWLLAKASSKGKSFAYKI